MHWIFCVHIHTAMSSIFRYVLVFRIFLVAKTVFDLFKDAIDHLSGNIQHYIILILGIYRKFTFIIYLQG